MPVSITASSLFFIFSSRRRHTRFDCDWSSDVCSSDLFSHHLPPDQYELRVKFDAHGGVLRTTPLTLEASPILFRIRERTAAEENEVTELEAMQKMGWDTTRVGGLPRAAGYKAALINWVGRRFSNQPDDPFLPF